MLIHNADITGSLTINGVPYNTGSYTGIFKSGTNIISGNTVILTGSFTGSFFGDGSQLSGVTSYTNADTLSFIQGYSGSYSGSFSGSFFGDGSNLSGVTSYTDADTLDFINSLNVVSGSIQTVSTVSDTFTSATSYTVTHNFGTKQVIVSVYENDTLIFPSSITTPTVNTVTITFPEPVTGRAVVVKAGHIVSGSINYNSVLNKPTLVSGSSQISFTGITNKPTLVSGSSQITYSGLTGIPSGIVSGSSQVSFTGITNKPTLISGSSQIAALGYATTGSNQFNGNQSITGSLTVSGQVVAQTLNIQQVTSSIVFSSGSNRFGNNSGNTHQFTGSLAVTGSLSVNGAGTFSSTVTAGSGLINGTTDAFFDLNRSASGNAGRVRFQTAGTDEFEIGLKGGVAGFHITKGDATELVSVLTSGNVGIGTTVPSAGLEIETDGSAKTALRVTSNQAFNASPVTAIMFRYRISSGTTIGGAVINAAKDNATENSQAGNLQFWTNNGSTLAERMQISSGGNLGLGVTPNIWFSDRRAFQIQSGGSINGSISTPSFVELGANFFHGSLGDTYISTTQATKYRQLSGAHEWYNAPSGTAGTAISFTQAMTLDASGRLGIGTTSPIERLHLRDTTTGYVGLRLEGTAPYAGSDWTIYASATAENSANDFLGFYNNSPTDGATAGYKLRIFKNGNVGIGTDSPNARLHVEIDSASEVDVARFRTINGADSQFLDISVDNTNNFVAYDCSGAVGGDHIFRRGGGEIIRITGTGITFNGDTAATNALDDYEEGTWTPTTNGDATGAFSTAYGEYTKIGNFVFFRAIVSISNNFTSSSIAGLPFTVGGNATASSLYGGNIIFNSVNSGLSSSPSIGSTIISIYSGSATSSNTAPTTSMATLRISGAYRV